MAVSGTTRFKDKKYQNWIKICNSLVILRDGLCSFTEDEIIEFKNVLQKKNSAMCGSPKCEKKATAGCQKCQAWVKDISAEYQGNVTGIYWKNTIAGKWETVPWEIAKVYMGKGQKKSNTGPQMTDCSGLLQLCVTCKRFKKIISNLGCVGKIQFQRNNTMHSATLEIEDEDMRKTFDDMIKFLQDPQKLASCKDAQEAVKKLKELRDTTCVLVDEAWLDMELEALRNRLSDLCAIIEAPDGTDREQYVLALCKTMDFIADHPELFENLQNEIGDLKQATQRIDGRVDKLEEDVQEQLREINVRIDKINSTATSVPYKNILQNHFAAKGAALPTYDVRQAAAGGFIGVVTVDGKTYESPRDDPQTRKRDAEQLAAKEAIEAIEIVTPTVALAATDGNMQFKNQLQYYLDGKGLPLADYDTKPTADVGFLCTVTALGRKFTGPRDPPQRKKKDAEQLAAKAALGGLGILEEDGSTSSGGEGATGGRDSAIGGRDSATSSAGDSATSSAGDSATSSGEGATSNRQSATCSGDGAMSSAPGDAARDNNPETSGSVTGVVSVPVLRSLSPSSGVSSVGTTSHSPLQELNTLLASIFKGIATEVTDKVGEQAFRTKLTMPAKYLVESPGGNVAYDVSWTEGGRRDIVITGETRTSKQEAKHAAAATGLRILQPFLHASVPYPFDIRKDKDLFASVVPQLFKINAILCSQGFALAKCSTSVDENKKIIAQLHMGLKYTAQSSASFKAAKQAEQNVAELIVKQLGLEGGSSSKEALHSYCGKNKLGTPVYKSEKVGNMFRSIVKSRAIVATNPIELTGAPTEDERSAVESVALKAWDFYLKDIAEALPPSVGAGIDVKLVASELRQTPSGALGSGATGAKPKSVQTKTQSTQGAGSGNYIPPLQEHLQKSGLPTPDYVEESQNQNGSQQFLYRVFINYKFTSSEEEKAKSQAEAETGLAQRVLRQFYPDIVSKDANKCKELLAKESAKVRASNSPQYTAVSSPQGWAATLSVGCLVTGPPAADKKTAKREAAKECLQKLQIL